MKNEPKKIYVLFQTDVWKSRASRVFCGVFESENAAIDAAKENDLYVHTAEVLILECELNKFEEQ